MKKVLFIDRDGTLIIEPEDEQIDSLEKLEYYPGVFTWLGKICREFDYELVMVTNQDGLGTQSFPEETFWPAHNRMLTTLENEGILFDEIIIDKTRPEDNQPTRKPGTALLTGYLTGQYDMANSYVIGDRTSDIMLAKNLKCKGIFINDGSLEEQLAKEQLTPYCDITTISWQEIYDHLSKQPRKAEVKRTTKETDIDISVNLDGTGKSKIDTGIAFFDHMLDQIAKHGQVDLDILVKGDLEVDEHHTLKIRPLHLERL